MQQRQTRGHRTSALAPVAGTVVTLLLAAGVLTAFLVSPLLLLAVALAGYLVVRPNGRPTTPGSPGPTARRGDHGFGTGTQ